MVYLEALRTHHINSLYENENGFFVSHHRIIATLQTQYSMPSRGSHCKLQQSPCNLSGSYPVYCTRPHMRNMRCTRKNTFATVDAGNHAGTSINFSAPVNAVDAVTSSKCFLIPRDTCQRYHRIFLDRAIRCLYSHYLQKVHSQEPIRG